MCSDNYKQSKIQALLLTEKATVDGQGKVQSLSAILAPYTTAYHLLTSFQTANFQTALNWTTTIYYRNMPRDHCASRHLVSLCTSLPCSMLDSQDCYTCLLWRSFQSIELATCLVRKIFMGYYMKNLEIS